MQSSTLPPKEVKKFIKGYKFPLYPNAEQIEILNKAFGSCRYVWNKALFETKIEYEQYLAIKAAAPFSKVTKPSLTGFSFVNRLMRFKSDPDLYWLYDTSSDVLQQTMLQLGDAFSRFFKQRKGYPKFKKRNQKQSITLTKNVFRFKNGQWYMAKSKDPLQIGFSRELPSDPSSCTISKSPTGMYYISFTCEYYPTPATGKGKIGLDLGLIDFITTSDGVKIKNPKHLKQHAKNLSRKQRAFSRKKKGSQNSNKARIKVARIHEVIKNSRSTFHHQLSRTLINENQVIGIEKLVVKNMVRNRKLAVSISDAGWSTFVSQLAYKSRESQHCNIVQMDTWYPSSHICHVTNQKLDRKLDLKERTWLCPFCHEVHDRDVNAAINIRNEAIYTIELNKIVDKGIFILAEQHR